MIQIRTKKRSKERDYMTFTIKCDDCSGFGRIEFEKGSAFIVCEDCGKEREIKDYGGEK
jgi:ribosomal protein S27E